MSTKKPINIQILDQKLTITTDAPIEKVQKVAEFVGSELAKVAQNSKKTTPYTAALLVAMNLAEKYLEVLESRETLKKDVIERSKKIVKILESAEKSANLFS